MCDHDGFIGFRDFKVFHEILQTPYYFMFLLLFATGTAFLAHAAQGVTVDRQRVYVEGVQVIHRDAFRRGREEQVVIVVYVILDLLARWKLHDLDLWQRGVQCGVVESVSD